MSDNDLSRRNFVKAMTGFAAAVGMANLEVPDLLASARANGNGGVIRWGMIGPGSRGQELLRNLSKSKVGQCIALCDVYPVNLKKGIETVGGNPTGYDDYRKMLERKDLDAVLIATPLHLHAQMTLDSLSAGKHVFCEKTLVFKEEEVKAVKEAAAAHPKQVLQVGLQRRYSLIYRMGMEMIKRGALGKVTHVRAQWHRNGNWRRTVKDPKLERQINWRMYKEYSGGLMAELGSHQTDIANWAFGAEPRSVIGFGGIDYWKDGREIFDNAQCLFEYASGQKLIYSSITTNAHLGFSEQILGDGGSLEVTLDGPSGKGTYWRETAAKASAASKEQWWAGATVTADSKQAGIPVFPDEITPSTPFLDREAGFAKRWLARKGWYEVAEPQDPVYVQLEHFLLCVRDGLKPVADVHVGTSDAECVIYSNRAMEENRRVYWPQYAQQQAPPPPAQKAKAAKKA